MSFGPYQGPQIGLSSSQLLIYKTAWNTFNNVYTYNAQVSTIVGSNPSAYVSYYRFANAVEIEQYRQGQLLHSITFPTSNWDSIGSG